MSVLLVVEMPATTAIVLIATEKHKHRNKRALHQAEGSACAQHIRACHAFGLSGCRAVQAFWRGKIIGLGKGFMNFGVFLLRTLLHSGSCSMFVAELKAVDIGLHGKRLPHTTPGTLVLKMDASFCKPCAGLSLHGGPAWRPVHAETPTKTQIGRNLGSSTTKPDLSVVWPPLHRN